MAHITCGCGSAMTVSGTDPNVTDKCDKRNLFSLLCRMCKVKKPFDMLCELFLNWGGLVLFWMWGITRTGVKWGLLNVLVGKRRSD